MLLPISPWGLDPVAAALQLGAGGGTTGPGSPARPLGGRSGKGGATVPGVAKSL